MGLFDMNKKTVSALGVGLFLVIGTYNAVVINSESSISSTEIKFVKRLDELYGVTQYARGAASAIQWQKLEDDTIKTTLSAPKRVLPTYARTKSVGSRQEQQSGAPEVAAAVQEALELDLTEVTNPIKWKEGINNTQFSGKLATNNGVIESLNVSLPNGEGVSVSFSEMSGNVFEYDLNGELYSGMMYQVDQNSYMITLTNGPLEGTRMRFMSAMTVEQEQAAQESIAQKEDAPEDNLGNDGKDTAPVEPQVAVYDPPQNSEEAANMDQQMQQQALHAQEQAAAAEPAQDQG
jgi:hypothetical protein